MQEQAEPWIAAPFIRVVLPFCGGILTADCIRGLSPNTLFPICLLLLAILVILHLNTRSLRAIGLFGIVLHCTIAAVGLLFSKLNDHRKSPHWFGHELPNSLAIVAEPEALPSLGPKSARYTMQAKKLLAKNGKVHIVSGKFLLYVPVGNITKVRPGIPYLFPVSNFKPLVSSNNPGSFDFARYNARKNIYLQTYNLPDQLIPYPASTGNKLLRWLTSAQQSALDAMDKTIPAPHNQLAKALLIGYREEVDKELLSTYSKTGVVHVIAVSGMHLGLIFFLLQRILVFPETRIPFTRWIKFFLVIIITWFFSAVAGSAGSIIRAASMFSFLLFAKLIHQPCSALQSISLTAFILLLWNPYWLYDAGFLLSFAALLSIVLFQPGLQPLFSAKHPVLHWIGELVAITLAAQILTFPLCIAFFHQAPIYFLPANLLAVPLSSLALIGTLIVWISYSAGFYFTAAGQVIYYLIDWMNQGIKHISLLPGAVIGDFNWNTPQVVTAYLFLFLIRQWIKTRYSKMAMAALCALVVWTILDVHQTWKHHRQHLLVVYHLPGKSAITVVTAHTSTYYLNRHTPAQHPALEAGNRFLAIKNWQFRKESILVLNRQLVAFPQENREVNKMVALHPATWILSRPITDITPITRLNRLPELVVIDGSVPEKRSAQWTDQLRQAGIKTHPTWEKGAFLQFISSDKPDRVPEK